MRESLPPLRSPHLWFPISTGVEVCSLAAGHSGSVLTKLCLFPGLQGSLGKLGSRGETNKKAPLSRTLKLLLRHIRLFYSTGVRFSSEERNCKRKQVFFILLYFFLETGPRDNNTAVVLSYVFFLSLNAILTCCLCCVFLWVFCLLLCASHLLLSSTDSALFVLCRRINIFRVKPKETADSNRHITRHI